MKGFSLFEDALGSKMVARLDRSQSYHIMTSGIRAEADADGVYSGAHDLPGKSPGENFSLVVL